MRMKYCVKYCVKPGEGARASALPVRLLDMTLDNLDESACVRHVMDALRQGRGGWIVTANVDILRRHTRDPQFRRLAAGASLVVADGMPLVWASRLRGTPLPQRVTGSNLVLTLSAAAAAAGRSIFLVGGAPGMAERAAQVLLEAQAGLRLAGPPFPLPCFDGDPAQLASLRAALAAARPDIVYVALGSPKQECLIGALRRAFPQTWWIGIGISFSFLAGSVRRAPAWLQNAGLEWLHRLIQEPRRLARRYLLHGIPFALYLLASALGWRLRQRLGARP
ncbi:MAG: WecB/TagA/CpsF family glycosyltransferase, partial [Pseudomonadota bacterium]